MAMSDWFLLNDDEGTVLIRKEDPLDVYEQKSIYKNKKVDFSILYSEQYKVLGYLFQYHPGKNVKVPRFTLYNCFGIMYSRKLDSRPKLEVVFEDQVVRVLSYEHSSDLTDYLIIGRWRHKTKMSELIESDSRIIDKFITVPKPICEVVG